MVERPFGCCYWVEPGRLLAGEYPGSTDPEEARRRLAALLDSGVTFVLDLTEDGEQRPYADLLGGATSRRIPIPDFTVPPSDRMAEILDTIDAALESGEVVYVHCRGGTGRTGTVVGCHLVRHGTSSEDALARIRELVDATPNAGRASPETSDQLALVRSWTPGR